MSFPRYPKYKPSGVEWLGEVPEHWGLKPLWTLFRRLKRVGHETEQLLSVYRDHGVVTKASRDDNFNSPSEDLSTYQLVMPGDLVINKMKAWQGSVAISPERGIVSPAYFVYETLHYENSVFLHLLMRSVRYIVGYFTLSKGIRVNQWDLEPGYHSRIPLLLPPIYEQEQIVNFLVPETAKIDALVAEQQRLIDLLKEKRQAVISHAVTKGLDPTVPMKPSGIEWLGDIPAHWKVGKCRFYISILCGFAFPSIGFSEDENHTRLMRGINVGVLRLRWDDTVYWKRSENDGLGIYELQAGDVVMGMDRPLISEGIRVAKVKPEDLPCLLLQRVASLKPNSQLDSNYLLLLLSSEMFIAHFSPDTTGVSVPHISPEQIGNFVIPIPPILEQRTIIEYVTDQLTKFDSLTTEAERAIELLQERRTALISAAVTGQIDVRQLAQGVAA